MMPTVASEQILWEEPQEIFIELRDCKEWKIAPVPEDSQIIIEFRHRIDYSDPAGWKPCWQLEINGTMISPMATRTASRLLNRPFYMKHRHHGQYPVSNDSDLWYSLYLPDYHAADGLFDPPSSEASRIVLDITDVMRNDRENVIRIRFGGVPPSFYKKEGIGKHRPALGICDFRIFANNCASNLKPMPLEDDQYVIMKKLPAPDFRLTQKKGVLEVQMGDLNVPIRSRFTTPDGNWTELTDPDEFSTPFYRVTRKIEKKENRIDIFDTYTSRSNELIGLKIRYETPVDGFDPIWVAGDKNPMAVRYEGGRNPSVFGTTRGKGIGLLAQDDIFRVQNVSRCEDGYWGIGTDTFALSPGESRTIEWSVYPVESEDYFDFVNTVRRDWNVNFPIAGGFTLGLNIYANTTREKAKNEVIEEGLTMRSTGPHFWNHLGKAYSDYTSAINGIGYFSPAVRATVKGKHILADPAPFLAFDRDCIAKCREYTPEIKTFIYLHNQISMQADDEKYNSCRLLAENGKQVYYGPDAKVFIPTEKNQLGTDFMQTLDKIVEKLNPDGIYLDESNHCRSRIHYGEEMWDGVSVELDDSFKVKRKISFVPLLKLRHTLNLFDRVISHHKKLMVANFSPETRSELKFRFPRFEETYNSRAVVLSHLYTPIQLGDTTTFKNTPSDMAADQRIALKRGALYYHYHGSTRCPSLTTKMFPFTPIEIHSGWMIGEERILTIHSGDFGWPGKNNLAELFVYDELGREVPDYPAEVQVTGTGIITRLNLKRNHCAAIVAIPVTAKLTPEVVLKGIRWENGVMTCTASGKGTAVFRLNERDFSFNIDGEGRITVQ